MITYHRYMYAEKKAGQDTPRNYVEGMCLSTDTKPDTVANGSILMEMDTSKLYLYDEANSIWREWE